MAEALRPRQLLTMLVSSLVLMDQLQLQICFVTGLYCMTPSAPMLFLGIGGNFEFCSTQVAALDRMHHYIIGASQLDF